MTLMPPAAALSDQTSDAPSTRSWITGEYLLWWVNGSHLPPLVTTSPASTPAASAGVLGTPGAAVLFGNTDVDDKARSGGRLTAGYWLDCEQTWGVEASFFILNDTSHGRTAGSNGDPILARPFFNTATGKPDAELVAFPGILSGNVAATSSSDPLLGAEALVRRNLLACDLGCGRGQFRLDALAGYRFLYLEEHLSVQENLTVTATDSPVPPGTTIQVGDRFDARNTFNGGEVGLAAEWRKGPWSLNLLGKLGLGETTSTVNINGSTGGTIPGSDPVVQTGGLLALGSNSGSHEGTHFSLVPQLDVSLGYQLTQSCRVTAGYSLLYWTDVARPGDQVDLAVNPALLPPAQPTDVQRPAFPFHRSSLSAQGLSVGITFRY
jgi:Putative beta barrel porin-7 (BBP7)